MPASDQTSRHLSPWFSWGFIALLLLFFGRLAGDPARVAWFDRLSGKVLSVTVGTALAALMVVGFVGVVLLAVAVILRRGSNG